MLRRADVVHVQFLARRLDCLLGDPERLAGARLQARTLADRFDLDESVRRLEAVYARVVETGPASLARRAAARAGPGAPASPSTAQPAEP